MAATCSYISSGAQSAGDIEFSAGYSRCHIIAESEARCYGSRQSAARSMGVLRRNGIGPKFDELVTARVHKPVDLKSGNCVAVAPLEQNRPTTHGAQRAGLSRRFFLTGKNDGLADIGSHESRKREQPNAHYLDSVELKKHIARSGNHNRIYNEVFEPQTLYRAGDSFNYRSIEKHSGFKGKRPHIGRDGADLSLDSFGRKPPDALHSHGILSGNSRYGRHSVTALGGKGLQVGLNSSAPAAVAAGYRHYGIISISHECRHLGR